MSTAEAQAPRPPAGPHPRRSAALTTLLCWLAFVAVADMVAGGARVLDEGDPHARWLLVNLAATLVLCGWALVRVRAQWSREATPAPVLVAQAPSSPADHRAGSAWRWTRRAVTLALLAVAVVTVVSEWPTLQSAAGQLRHLDWRTLRWGLYAEALAMVAFAQLTRLLLRAGGVRLRLGAMIGLTLASNAVSLSLPGGPAWAVTFSFDQLRRRGVRRSLSAYALAVTWILSAAALIVLAVVGIDLAGARGPAAPFRALATAVGVALVLGAVLAVVLARRPAARAALGRRLERLCSGRRVSSLARSAQAGARELGAVRTPAPLLARCVVAALLNWVLDCGCLAFSILAVGGHVPWAALLAVYAITQLAAALPLTPGGIGVVEGTLSLLLIAYHVPASTAIAGVLLYRVISFWILVPVGWGAVAGLVARQRRSRTRPTWISRVRMTPCTSSWSTSETSPTPSAITSKATRSIPSTPPASPSSSAPRSATWGWPIRRAGSSPPPA